STNAEHRGGAACSCNEAPVMGVERIRALIDTTTAFAQKLVESVQELMLRLTGVDIGCCPKCGQGTMIVGAPIARAAFDTS
ncbi:MAG: hypothetical protein KJO32_12145, partial [Deltaproteobacteria bacterium]|nr:hypothetical protein [Deltaproteobacteria bacterium]